MGRTEIRVEVGRPELVEAEGTLKSSFMLYTLRTAVRRNFGNEWIAGTYEVRRRYRDFAWLDSRVAGTYPGAIRPPLPGTAGSFLKADDEGFIEGRRRLLEVHPT